MAITENLLFDLTDRRCFPFRTFHGKQSRVCGFACFIDRLIVRMDILRTFASVILLPKTYVNHIELNVKTFEIERKKRVNIL